MAEVLFLAGNLSDAKPSTSASDINLLTFYQAFVSLVIY